MSEQVNHPQHYNQGGIECIDAMEAAIASLATDTIQMKIVSVTSWSRR